MVTNVRWSVTFGQHARVFLGRGIFPGKTNRILLIGIARNSFDAEVLHDYEQFIVAVCLIDAALPFHATLLPGSPGP